MLSRSLTSDSVMGLSGDKEEEGRWMGKVNIRAGMKGERKGCALSERNLSPGTGFTSRQGTDPALTQLPSADVDLNHRLPPCEVSC